ncbi:hypothetical protein MVEG_01895 [Podila verticillata NRRL 6337]|nr:hypothetical protein MVEG_01895 [Podila verticillata NRRL 6337]
MPSILNVVGTYYNRQFQSHPMLTICTTNTFLAGISDSLTQTYLTPHSHDQAKIKVKDKDKDKDKDNWHQEQSIVGGEGNEILQGSSSSFDYPRLARFMFYNFSVAPLIHTWFTVLDKRFPIPLGTKALPSSHVTRFAPRLLTTMAPGLKRMVVDQALFAPFGLALMFSSLTLLEGGNFADTYLTALKANYAVWPLVQFVNFRLPFVSLVGIAWNAFLSLTNSRGQVIHQEHPALVV